jgi:hypothetical protein
MMGLMNIIYYFMSIHRLTRLVSIDMEYGFPSIDEVDGILTARKTCGLLAALHEDKKVFGLSCDGSKVESKTWG